MRKILIIDDEPDIAFYLKILFEDNGYVALTANDAETGFRIAQQELPGLICLDIMMPRKSGITLYRELKKDERLRDIPVVIISGVESIYSFTGKQFRRLIPDQDIPEPLAFFEKPVSVPSLLEFLTKTFGSPTGELE
jgi:twitching motility two-component system response regulator PilH